MSIRLIALIAALFALAIPLTAVADDDDPSPPADKAHDEHADKAHDEHADKAHDEHADKAHDEPADKAHDEHGDAPAAAPQAKAKKPEAKPEADEESGADEGDPVVESEVETALGAQLDPKKYAEMLRGVLAKHKEKVLDKLDTKFEQAQEKRMNRIGTALMWVSLGGLLLLFAPLVLARRYPGKFALLFKYSILAAVSFTVTMLLFSQVTMVLRTAQGAAASITNPQRHITEAAFDVLVKQAEEIAPLAPALLAAPLAKVASGEEESIIPAIMNNVSALKSDVVVFKKIAGWFKNLTGVMGYIPTILTVLTVVAFLVSMRPVLTKIVRLPIEAAEGRATGGQVIKQVLKTLGWELVVTLALIVILVVVTLFSGISLGTLIEPAIEALLAYAFASIFYVMSLAKGFSTTWIYVSLVGAMLFLALNVASVVMSSGMYIGKAQKLLRARFHDKMPFRSQWKFWVFGTLSLIWLQLTPLLFINIAKPAAEKVLEYSLSSGDLSLVNWPLLLSSGPLILGVGFFLFWLCWGLKPLLFIARYPVKAPEPPPPLASVPPVIMPAAQPA